jgi:HAE1 family hydrophobic/amphiphilic exporter-1
MWDAGFARLARGYGHVLGFAIGTWRRWLVIALLPVALGGAILLVSMGALSMEFMPQPDDGKLQVGLEMPAGTSLEATNTAAQQLEQRLTTVPEVTEVFSTVGQSNGGGMSAANAARFATMFVQLEDKHERQRTTLQVAEEIRGFAAETPGATVTAATIGQFGGGGPPLMVHIQGEDPATVTALAQQVALLMRNVPGTRTVDDGGVTGQPEMVISIDAEKAADLGLSEAQVAGVLRTGLAGSRVSSFRPQGTTGWDINVILNPDQRDRLDQVRQIPLVTPAGAAIHLGDIASIEAVPGPTQILRYNRQRTVLVSAYVSDRPTGDVAADIQSAIDKNVIIPTGYTVAQGGMGQQQSESFGQMAQALALSILFIYMLMTALYENLVYPFIVLLSLPLAAAGAFGLLSLTGNTLNMMSMVGLVMLTGLVGKPAILLVDYTNTLRKRGLARNPALLEAGPTRLRPILMTSMALILAMTPVALKMGEGGEMYASLAVTVIGGMITSTVLTLVLIPAVYTVFDDASRLVTRFPHVFSVFRRSPPRPTAPRRAPAPAGAD